MEKFKKIFIPLISFLLITNYYLPINALAQQSPELILTWQAADSYAPADYQGKILPNKNSSLSVAAALVDGGKMTDLSKYEVRWFLNNAKVAGGVGLTKTNFPLSLVSSRSRHELRAEIINYKRQKIAGSAAVPVASPQVIISAPLFNFKLANSSVVLTARPYFFSVSSLNELLFNWRAGREETSGRGANSLELSASGGESGSALSVSVEVRNENEIASASAKFFLP